MQRHEKLIVLIGILGLCPFIFGFIDLLVNTNDLLLKINIPKYYGVIILSFLGAQYWGIILIKNNEIKISDKLKSFIIVYSILPSLIGMIVFSVNDNISLIILAISFILSQIIDELLKSYVLYPSWYLILRRILTLIVISIIFFSYIIIK